MTTRDEYLKQSVDARLARLARTADDLAAAIRSHDDTTLSRRPEPKAWSAKEVVCHLDAERWAEEWQYLRNDTVAALDAFRRRRGEALGLLRALTPEWWRVPASHLEEAQDDAVRLAVADMEAAGVDVLTDGEQRRESYFNEFANALSGIDVERPGEAINRLGKRQAVPRVTGPIRRE